jgi:hypothetical protein
MPTNFSKTLEYQILLKSVWQISDCFMGQGRSTEKYRDNNSKCILKICSETRQTKWNKQRDKELHLVVDLRPATLTITKKLIN